MDSKYENGKIYRIVCNTTGKYYYGSTHITLEDRLIQHKRDFKRYLNVKFSYISSFDILENNNYIIELVEEYPCSNKRDLEKQEDIYIKKFMNDDLCVNKSRAFTTKEEKREIKKKYRKQYNKQYNKKNRDKIRERNKQKYIKNRDKYSERDKQKCYCLCGANIRRDGFRRHLKSPKHHTTLLHLVKKKCSDIL